MKHKKHYGRIKFFRVRSLSYYFSVFHSYIVFVPVLRYDFVYICRRAEVLVNITFVSAVWDNMCKLEGGMYDKLHIDRYGGHLIVPVSK